MKILLVGNPNVGKSVVFSRLTGVDVITSNYPGTTVEFMKGDMRLGRETVDLIDTPGAYSLEPRSKAEEVTARLVGEADIIINVVDATNLERNLYLTSELLEKKVPIIVALNMWDDATHLGIEINPEKLEEILGVPVVPTVALTGEGVRELVSRIPDARSPEIRKHTDDERWADIGRIVEQVQVVKHRHHTIWERFTDATIRPVTGIPLAFFVIYVLFQMVRFIGEGLIEYVSEPVFEMYKPFLMGLSQWLGQGILHDILIGRLIDGGIEYTESMGLLTTGLYVPFAAVLPYIIAFYFMLSLLEDTGYLPRLATLMDTIFHRLGMHGHGIVPVFLGVGCNVTGALATRTLETRKQRFIALTLLAIAVPCMAQVAMIFGILGRYGMDYIYLVFIILVTVYLVLGLLLNRFVKGESPEIFLEVPQYRRPDLITSFKKTWLRVRWFLMDALPWLFLGILLVNILYITGFLESLGGLFAPFMEIWLGLPREAVVVLLAGFLRKDLAVGMLLPLNMSPLQLVIATVMLTLYFPCVATFATMVRELGIRDMIKSTLIMILTALTVGGILKIILLGF